jgi:hypothetical protein
MRNVRITRSLATVLVAGLSLTTFSSCASELTRTGSSPVFVIVDFIEAAAGATPDDFGGFLLSDVVTNGGIFNDVGRAQFRIALKNPGPGAIPTTPSSINQVTLNRYRVTYRRADGRNTAGVDVPHAFDGAFTATIPQTGEVIGVFEMVRHQAKAEPPLANLAGLGGRLIISTIAEVTFYGRDQAGNEVEATTSISVNFGDFADPESDSES